MNTRKLRTLQIEPISCINTPKQVLKQLFFACEPGYPLGKCPVTEVFFRSCLEMGHFAESGLHQQAAETAGRWFRAEIPETGRGRRSSAAKKLKIDPASSANSGKRWILSGMYELAMSPHHLLGCEWDLLDGPAVLVHVL